MLFSHLQIPEDFQAKVTMRPRPIQTILFGGLTIAVLDIILATGFWALYRDVPARVILQSIASGVLGKAAFSGGAGTTALGAFLHCVIACGIAAVYYVGTLRWPVLLRKPVVSGLAYGLVVYLVMTRVIVPLSLATPGAFNPAWFAASIFSHLVLVGLPLAFIARWSARHNQG